MNLKVSCHSGATAKDGGSTGNAGAFSSEGQYKVKVNKLSRHTGAGRYPVEWDGGK